MALPALLGPALFEQALAQDQPAQLQLVVPKPDSENSTQAAGEALRAGQPVLAEQLAGRVIAMTDPPAADEAQALLIRGLAREQLGRPFEAVADFTKAVELNVLPTADLARAYFDRGVTRDGMGETPEAIADYGAALKLVPEFPAALNNRANAYRRSGQLDVAKLDYNASLVAGNSAPEYSYFGLGQIAEAEGDVEKACDFYRKALQANGEYKLASKRLSELGEPWSVDKLVLRPPRTKLALSVRPARRTSTVQSEVSALPLRPAMLEAKKAKISTPDVVALTDPSDTVPAAAKVDTAHTARVQLGSFNSEADANEAWKRLMRVAGAELSGLSPQVMVADIPGRGRFYRLRAGPVSAPVTLCSSLKVQGIDCLPVRN